MEPAMAPGPLIQQQSNNPNRERLVARRRWQIGSCLRPVRGEMFIVLEEQNTSSPFGGAETDLKDKSQPARPLLRTEKVGLLVFMIGIGRSLTAPPSHTTRHTGPYRAVRLKGRISQLKA
jgi:hypothetical protein